MAQKTRMCFPRFRSFVLSFVSFFPPDAALPLFFTTCFHDVFGGLWLMDALMQDKLRLAGKVQSGVLLYAHPNARGTFEYRPLDWDLWAFRVQILSSSSQPSLPRLAMFLFWIIKFKNYCSPLFSSCTRGQTFFCAAFCFTHTSRILIPKLSCWLQKTELK
jgi:hypothetical protein